MDFFFKKIVVKYRDRDDIISGRSIDKAGNQTKAAEDESSQIWVGRVVSTDSHRKRLAKRGGFRAPRSTRRRQVRSVEKLRDEVAEVGDEVVTGDVVREVAEEVVGDVGREAAREVVEEVIGPGEVDGVVVYEMVQPNIVVDDLVSSVIVDTEVTAPSTYPSFMLTDGGFPGGPVNRSVLIEYADHVALRLWQREVYVFYV